MTPKELIDWGIKHGLISRPVITNNREYERNRRFAQSLRMRRLRAERRGLDTTGLPPRVRRTANYFSSHIETSELPAHL